MTTNNTVVSRREAREHFLLLEPAELNDAERIAKAMAMCRGVKKVFLTSGEYGFVVSVAGDSFEDAYSKVKKLNDGGAISTIMAHREYSKRR